MVSKNNSYHCNEKKFICVGSFCIAFVLLNTLNIAGSLIQRKSEFSQACTIQKIQQNIEKLKQLGGIVNATSCPSDPYLMQYFKMFKKKRKGRKFNFIEIGCNKATDAVMMLRMFTQNPEIDLEVWFKRARFTNPPECEIDWESHNNMEKNQGLTFETDYQHYCIEPVRENFEIIKRVSNELKYDQAGLSIHQLAMSNTDAPSIAKFPVSDGQLGIETLGLHTIDRKADKSVKKPHKFYDVNVTSLDKFVVDQKIMNIDVLKIDTEGNDALVILGSLKTLSTLRPSYITFENHGIGHWKIASLREIIDILDLLSYTCFWATFDGFLIRVTSCWHSSYGKIKDWSNIACYNRNDKEYGKIMESFAI